MVRSKGVLGVIIIIMSRVSALRFHGWVFTVRVTQHTQKASALLFGFRDFTVVCKMA